MDRPADRQPGVSITSFVLANVALGLVAMTICLPAMPLWTSELNASAAAVQATYGTFIATFALAQLVCGPASDQFGRRSVLVLGLVVFVAASMVCAAATGIEVMLLGRAAQGAGAGVGFVVGRALIQDLYAGAARTRIIAYSGMALGLSAPAAALLGGWLESLFDWRAAFLCSAVIGGALLAFGANMLPRHRPSPGRRRAIFSGYATLFRSPNFLCYVMAAAGCTATFYTYLGGAPAVLHGLGTNASAVGWYVFFCSGAYIVGNFATSRLTALPDRWLLAGGQLCCLGGTIAILVAGLQGNEAALMFAAPMLLVGFGHGLIHPPVLRGAVEVSAQDVGAAAAVSGAVQQGSGAVAGLALAVLAPLDQTAVASVMVAATVLSAAAALPLILASGGTARISASKSLSD